MKNKKILLICTPILLVISIFLSYIKVINVNTDAIKFKEEYEAYNNKDAYSKNKYKSLNVSKNNPIKYSNYNELIDIITNKTGIIYFGFPECPWCRSALPVLFEAASNNKIDTIYYLNILNERDEYAVEDGKLIYQIDDQGKEKKGTKGYFKLLELLDKYLTDYTISFEGKEYITGEKRLYAPSVIFIKDGEVLGIHVSTVESHKSGFDEMTNEQEKELYGIYEDYILEMKETTCPEGSAC